MYSRISLIENDRDIYINDLLSIDVLHDAYHDLASYLEEVSGCLLYLLDATFSTRLHYISRDRSKLDFFIEAILSSNHYFSIRYKDKVEKYYTCETFSKENIPYSEISSFKIYSKIYYEANKLLVFASRVGLVVDFWREEDGLYKSNQHNKILTELSSQKFSESITRVTIGNRYIPSLNVYANLHKKIEKNPIDIVYTWVDAGDKAWVEKKEKRLNNYFEKEHHSVGVDPVRYIDNNEIIYSLRSILTYFKGFRKIFIVTDNQSPSFLDLQDSRIEIVDHKDIFLEEEHLPTYNSHAIGSQLHRISGLSQKYLYFNDDILLGRVVTRELFFDDVYEKAKCFYSNTVMIPPTDNSKEYSLVNNAAINNRKLLEKKFGVHVKQKFQHTPVAVIKSVIEEMERDFPEIFLETASHPIRSDIDYSIAGAFYYHYGLIKGRIYPSTLEYTYRDIGIKKFALYLKNILERKESERYDIICINSVVKTELYNINARYFNKIFVEYFPYKAIEI